MALLLDMLATILSAGLSTAAISRLEAEYSLSQVFIAIDITRLPNHSAMGGMLEAILSDYKQSIPQNAQTSVTWPGERVLRTRAKNSAAGIPVLASVWTHINQL